MIQDAPSLRTTIAPARTFGHADIAELWRFRELLYFFVWRDLKVRYKQTVLGALWAIIQPLTTTIVFTFVFGRIGNVYTDGIPYSIFSFSALTLWTFFGEALAACAAGMVANARLITKVYFPRVVLPIAAVSASLVDLMITSALLVSVLAWAGRSLDASALLAPMFVALAMATTLGAGLWLSALNVRYRDIRYTVPFLVQLWLFASPVAYPQSAIPAQWQVLYAVNPMAGAIQGFRWAMVGGPGPQYLLVSVTSAVALLLSGFWYFRRLERVFADEV